MTEPSHRLECVECRAIGDLSARGWIAYRADDPESDEPPEIAFRCPACVEAARAG